MAKLTGLDMDKLDRDIAQLRAVLSQDRVDKLDISSARHKKHLQDILAAWIELRRTGGIKATSPD